MNSKTFLLLSNSNSEIDRNQKSFGTIDFQPNPPTLTPVFANLDQEMNLTIGSLNFRVDSLGSIRLSYPTKSGPSAEETASAVISDSLVGSSSEVNIPVSYTPTETTGCTIEELDEIIGNLDLE
jgi:hypothetical protein